MSSRKLTVAGVLGPFVAVLAVLSTGQIAGTNIGGPLPNVTDDEQARFVAGQATFANVETAADDGLGPVFNENACAVCHNVWAIGGGSTRLETRLGTMTDGVFDPMTDMGGSLMQDHAIGLVGGINYVAEVVPASPPFPRAATIVAERRTTPLFGLGLVDNVPDSLLMQIAQFEQERAPDTAGRVNIVVDRASGQQRVGPFGWKCQQATLFTFSGDALRVLVSPLAAPWQPPCPGDPR
jgi:hypothetical protein